MPEAPSLGNLVISWVEAHCVVPDGEHRGEPFVPVGWQEEFYLHFYRLHPDAHERYLPDADRKDWTRPSRAFFYDRGAQVVMPKKSGKGPLAASWVCAEAAGPVLFDGWVGDERAEWYRCDQNGCGCGWRYRYEAGEPRGRPWATPWIEVTAASEDQAGNVWRALLPMIREGPLGSEWPDAGETRINLPGGGVIVPVTSSPRSRRGARATACVQDETQDWTDRNGGYKLAASQRDNLAGMGGRFLETDNAWDPNERSVAESTYTKGVGVYKLMPSAGKGSIRNRRERDRMLSKVYSGSWWVDLDRISVETDEKLALGDLSSAERLYLNRVVPAEDRAIDPEEWNACAVRDAAPPEGVCLAHPADDKFHDRSCGRPLITVGVDGARYIDSLAIVATEVGTGFQWVAGIWERPENAPDGYEHPLDEVDHVLMDLFSRYNVWRVYADPGSQVANIGTLVDKWQGRWGEKRVVTWLMFRARASAMMIRGYVASIRSGEVRHNGDPVLTRHALAARRRPISYRDDDGGALWTVQKEFPGSPERIDAFAAAALSWEASREATSSGAQNRRASAYEDQLCRCQHGPPGVQPHLRGPGCRT